MIEGRERVTVVTRREALVDHFCRVRGATFVGLSRQRYRGPSCAARAAYLRQADARKAVRRERCRAQRVTK